MTQDEKNSNKTKERSFAFESYLRYRNLIRKSRFWGRLLGTDSQGRGFLRKFVFRGRTVGFSLTIYVIFFLRENIIQLIPYISNDKVSIKNLSTNYVDTIKLEGIDIKYIRPAREDIHIRISEAILTIGKQKKGDRLLALNSIVLMKGSVDIVIQSSADLNPDNKGFKFILDRIESVRELFFTQNISFLIEDFDVNFHFKKSDASTSLKFNLTQAKVKGQANINGQEFCSTIGDGNASFLSEAMRFSASGCIYKDLIRIPDFTLYSQKNQPEKVQGEMNIYPESSGDVTGALRLKFHELDLNRFLKPGKVKNLSSIKDFYVVYNFEEYNQDELSAHGNYRGSPVSLNIQAGPLNSPNSAKANNGDSRKKKSKTGDSSRLKWAITGRNKSFLSALGSIFDVDYDTPSFLRYEYYQINGEDRSHNGLHFGFAKAGSRLRWHPDYSPLRFNFFLSYSPGLINFHNIELNQDGIIARGKGSVGRARGWDINFLFDSNGLKKIESISGDRSFYSNVKGDLHIKGSYSQPHYKLGLTLRNASLIDYRTYYEARALDLKKGRAKEANQPEETRLQNIKFDLRKMVSQRKRKLSTKKREVRFAFPGLPVNANNKNFKKQNKGTLKKEVRSVLYYNELNFELSGMENQLGRKWNFSLQGYETEQKKIEHEPILIKAIFSNVPNYENFSLLVTRLSIDNYILSLSMLGKKRLNLNRKYWDFTIEDVSLKHEERVLINGAKLSIIKPGLTWMFQGSIRSEKQYQAEIEGKSWIAHDGLIKFDFATQVKILRYDFLDFFGFNLSPLQGTSEINFLYRNTRSSPLISVSWRANKLSWKEKKKQEQLGALNFALRLDANNFTLALLHLQNKGWLDWKISTALNWDPKTSQFIIKGGERFNLLFRNKDYRLDGSNAFFQGLRIQNQFIGGFLQGDLQMRGSVSNLVLDSDLKGDVKEWRIPFNTLRNFSLSIDPKNGDRGSFLILASLEAFRGQFRLEASADLRNLLFPISIINFYANNIRLNFSDQDYVSIELMTNVYLSPFLKGVSGFIRLSNGKYYLNEFKYLRKKKDKNIELFNLKTILDQIFKDWYLDLNFSFTDNFLVKSNLGNIEIRGGGQLSYFLDRSFFQADLNLYRGTIYLQNNDFELERGRLTMFGFDPRKYFVSLEAKTEIAGGVSQQEALFYSQASEQSGFSLQNEQFYDVYLLVNGELGKPVLEFRSNPPLPRDRILTGLVMGQIIPQSGGGIDLATTSTAAAVNIFTNQINTLIERRTGLDTFKIQIKDDVTQSSSAVNTKLNFTVGQYITRKLYVQYQQQLINAEEQPYLVTLEYNLTDWLKLIGSLGKDDRTGQDKQNVLLLFNFRY